MSTLTGQFNYSGMEHFITNVKSKSGEMIECVVLPLKSNYIEKTEKNGQVYLNQGIAIYDVAPEKQKNGNTNTIKLYPKKEVREALKAAGKYTPYLGNLKNWDAPAAEVNTSENFDASADIPTDDLPF